MNLMIYNQINLNQLLLYKCLIKADETKSGLFHFATILS
jgi:hypothetical protein